MSVAGSEYQHFIPQFIVRNYSFPFKCPKAEQQEKKKCKCKHEKGKHPGDLVVNGVNLNKPPFQLGSYSVKRIFGAPDMYNDPTRAETREQRRIESMFGKMESQASVIFRRIVKSHEAGDTIVTLTRIERDLVRKFLFLLKYRGSKFHQRFYHEISEDYCANDRELLLDYMRDRGFSTPRDVWFHNLEAIMNLDMDSERKWAEELPRKMYPDDACWFIMHVDMYYMAICTPVDAADEFLLTDNCYNVFEGPNTFIKDEITGLVQGGNHAGFHEFAPLSPRLLIVLRCSVLPNSEEDKDPEISQRRQDDYWSSFGHIYGPGQKSLLEDLPIKKCTNSYSEIIGGAVRPNAGYDGIHRPNDKFYFKYHPIKTGQVRTINNIFLDNAYCNSMIAFRNAECFFNILELYISGPCESNKIVGGDDADRREQFLRELEKLVKALGSQKSLVWRRMDMPRIVSSQAFMNKQLEHRRMMSQRIMEGATQNDPMMAFFQIYIKLGTKSGFERDLAQAGKMVYFQSVVEALSFYCSNTIQSQTKTMISSMFRASFCSRYWLYLKLLRKSKLGDRDGTQDSVDIFVTQDIRQGPEDIFAQTAQLYDENTLNNLMRTTVLNDIDKRRYKIKSIWRNLSVDIKNAFYQALVHHPIVFARPGQIRHCGIRNIELLAKKEEKILRTQSICRDLSNFPFENEDQRLELAVRVRVRSKFQALLAGKAEDSLLRELEDVFFRLTFPTPPSNDEQRSD